MSVSLPLLIRDIFGSRNYTQIHAWIRTGVGLFGSFSGVLVGAVYDTSGTFVPAFLGLAVTCLVAAGCVALAYRSRRKLVWETEDAVASAGVSPSSRACGQGGWHGEAPVPERGL